MLKLANNSAAPAQTAEPGIPCIEINGLSKRFWMERERAATISGFFVNLLRLNKRQARHSFWALRDISFKVYPGETVGMIGANGSGKSTLLKLISGIYAPTQGSLIVRKRLVALLELGTGFNAELTGRENIFLNGSLLGVPRRKLQADFDSIVDFADVRDFVDIPLKYYSSGMRVRLGFAVAIHVDAEIMLLDEIFAVGDSEFQNKCMQRLRQFQAEGRTLFLVSHSMDLMRSLCTRTFWLSRGKVIREGPTEQIVAAYKDYVDRLL
jgi:ABC-type polysaccharide/polyol phosphate transport system ATPase subunit